MQPRNSYHLKVAISYELTIKSFNMEKDPWPYDDESLDLVIASEVIEHLTQDPMHVISEANRVLKDNGKLFISTPNLSSLWKLNRMFDGFQPIGDPFYRLDSVYNRHNRELTPEEIESCMKAAVLMSNIFVP